MNTSTSPRRKRNRKDQDVESSLAPLLDLSMVLSAIFLLMVVLRPAMNTLPIQLAKVKDGKAVEQQLSNDLVITILGTGDVEIDQQTFSLVQIQSRLEALAMDSRETNLIVASDRSTPFESVAKVLSLLRDSGHNATLLTSPDSTSD